MDTWCLPVFPSSGSAGTRSKSVREAGLVLIRRNCCHLCQLELTASVVIPSAVGRMLVAEDKKTQCHLTTCQYAHLPLSKNYV